MKTEGTEEIDFSRQLRLLVVDDVAVHRFLLASGLGRINPFIKVEEAGSGGAAMDKLGGAEHYDAVICDWLMPGGSGEDLLRWMRARPHFRRVPFIMVSSKNTAQDIIEAFTELGVDGYVVKPFMPRDVYRKVVDTIDRMAGKNSR
ncbi:MAG: response regulator [Pseudomonadota bacterium]|nr:response regulator [Pseudomonadota bacterium]